MGQKLLTGWTMLGDCCPSPECVGVPLMKKDGVTICVLCNKTATDQPPASVTGQPAIISAASGTGSTSTAPSTSSGTTTQPPTTSGPTKMDIEEEDEEPDWDEVCLIPAVNSSVIDYMAKY
jgi:uncharacterized Zn finger protein (UPF0148 family)